MVPRGELTRGDVHLVILDPTVGSEIRKTRPCVVVSPNELNRHLRTAIVAPLTTGGRAYPWRIPCRFQPRAGFVALDQIRPVDVDRLSARLGRLASRTVVDVLQSLQQRSPPASIRRHAGARSRRTAPDHPSSLLPQRTHSPAASAASDPAGWTPVDHRRTMWYKRCHKSQGGNTS